MIDFRNEKSLFYKIGMILLLPIDIVLIGTGVYSTVFNYVGLANKVNYIIPIFIILTSALSGTKCVFAKKATLTGVIMYLTSFVWLIILILKIDVLK